MIEKILRDGAQPVEWASEQKGMSGGDEIEDIAAAEREWFLARDSAIAHAQRLVDLGVHKSIANRLTEPYAYHTAIITSTDWQNFFKQRCTPQAQPEIRVVAEMMRDVYDASIPSQLEYGQWHLPLLTEQDRVLDLITQLKISAARCARVSYLTHDGVRSIEADLTLFDETLAKYGHWSPLEHVAVPLVYARNSHQGNFSYPWVQLRALVEAYGHGTLDAVDSVIENGYHPVVSGFSLSPITKDAP
jgi:hypothetical protein